MIKPMIKPIIKPLERPNWVVRFIARPLFAPFYWLITNDNPMNWVEEAQEKLEAARRGEKCYACDRKITERKAILRDSDGKITRGTARVCRYAQGTDSNHTRKIYDSLGQEVEEKYSSRNHWVDEDD